MSKTTIMKFNNECLVTKTFNFKILTKMKNIQKNKKSWFRGLVVAGVFAISMLNLSIEFQRNTKGDFELNLTSMKVKADDGGGEEHVCCALISTSHCVTVSVVTPGGNGEVKNYEFAGLKFNCPK
jgi:hypothetical protein